MANLIYEPIDTLVDRCVSAGPDAPLAFFAGSAVSFATPSVIPGAWIMLEATLQAVMPVFTPDEPDGKDDSGSGPQQTLFDAEGDYYRHRIHKIMPEIYYEILTEILGPQALRVWEALRFWHEDADLVRASLGPNAGHLVLVYLAWKSGTPIVTTNFDTLFEAAARALGLGRHVCCSGEPFTRADHPNKVAIWKVHGSVAPEKFHTIQTTLRRLTALDEPKISALQDVFQEERTTAVLIGYSGRDLDLFPYFVAFNLKQRPFWVDFEFRQRFHILHELEEEVRTRFVTIQGKVEDLADRVLACLNAADPMVNRLRKEAASAAATTVADAKAVYEDKVRRHVTEVLTALLPSDDPRRLLIQARALSAVDLKKTSYHFADLFVRAQSGYKSPERAYLMARGFLLKAEVAHDLARFEESRYWAGLAQEIAERSDLWMFRTQAVIAADEALRSQYFPRLRYKDHWLMACPVSWLVFGRLVKDCFRLRSRGRNRGPGETAEDADRTARLYIEHVIRTGAILQGALLALRWFGKPGMPFLRYLWSRVGYRSLQLGYAQGYGAACRYAQRVGLNVELSPIMGSQLVFELLQEGEGRAMAYRDQAEQLAEQAKRATDAVDRSNLVNRALNKCDQAYEQAISLGDHSLAVKALIERRHTDASFRADWMEVTYLLSTVQGSGYQRVANSLRRWLCGKP